MVSCLLEIGERIPRGARCLFAFSSIFPASVGMMPDKHQGALQIRFACWFRALSFPFYNCLPLVAIVSAMVSKLWPPRVSVYDWHEVSPKSLWTYFENQPGNASMGVFRVNPSEASYVESWQKSSGNLAEFIIGYELLVSVGEMTTKSSFFQVDDGSSSSQMPGNGTFAGLFRERCIVGSLLVNGLVGAMCHGCSPSVPLRTPRARRRCRRRGRSPR